MILFKKQEPKLPYWLAAMKPRIPSIDELARGRFVGAETMMRLCNTNRSLTRTGGRGYSRNKLNRKVASIPYEMHVHPEYGKYFQSGMDKHERWKNLRAFLRKFPEYQAVDKL